MFKIVAFVHEARSENGHPLTQGKNHSRIVKYRTEALRSSGILDLLTSCGFTWDRGERLIQHFCKRERSWSGRKPAVQSKSLRLRRLSRKMSGMGYQNAVASCSENCLYRVQNSVRNISCRCVYFDGIYRNRSSVDLCIASLRYY